MSILKPLARSLARSFRRRLLRRALVWAACSVMALTLGGALSSLFANGHVLRLGLTAAVLSCLPAFLFWPFSEKDLVDRLRLLDEEMVFEAYLEAEPGPVRDILRKRAGARASVLAVEAPPTEPLLRGIKGLLFASLLCLVTTESVSLLLFGRSVPHALERPATLEGGRRIEEQGFTASGMEDPDARRSSRGHDPEWADEASGVNPHLGAAESSAREATFSSRWAPQADGPSGSGTTEGEMTEGGESGEASATGPSAPAPAEAHGEKGKGASESGGGDGPLTPRSEDKSTGGKASDRGSASGRGYDHTGDTRVPSPLLDYRAQFEYRYAERTGKRLAASGRMGLGALRTFQRQYFDSFALRVDVGSQDDPRTAMLKLRWRERKGGSW